MLDLGLRHNVTSVDANSFAVSIRQLVYPPTVSMSEPAFPPK